MSESKHSEAEVIGALKYLQTGRKTEDTFSPSWNTVAEGNSQEMRVGLDLESAQI